MSAPPELELGSPEFWQRLASDPSALAAQVCSIDLVNLEKTLQHHAGLYAWVAASFEAAEIAEERAKWTLDKAHAIALLHAKQTPDPDTGKAKLADVLKAEAATSADVLHAKEEHLSVMEKVGALRAMSRALGDRRDMLVQLSAAQRAERRG